MRSQHTPVFRTVFILILALGGFGSAISQTDQTIYKIQVASSAREYPIEQIQKELLLDEPLSMHYLNGRYKYFIKSFTSLAEAERALANVPVHGAFVVPITGQTVEKTANPPIIKSSGETSTGASKAANPTSGGGQVQKVKVIALQIGASKVKIEPVFFKNKYKLTEEVRFFQKDGWYKYVIGRFKSEKEASNRLTQLSIPAFVTSYIEEIVVPKQVEAPKVEPAAEKIQQDSSIANQDTSGAETEKFKAQVQRKGIGDLYNQKANQADSAFQAGNLVLARKYYVEAKKLDPGKMHPDDQIYEIDKRLKGEATRSLFRSRWVVTYAIFGFVGIMVIVLIITLFLRTRRKRLERNKLRLREQYQDSITEYLFDEKSGHPETLHEADTERKKQILMDEIMQLYANLSGEISNKLRELYLDLGLDNESVQKTKSPQWHIRAKGFRELAQMNIQTVNDEIEKCLNSTNDVLRMEAQLAMVRLSFNDPFSFLDKLQQPFTSWEQLHVYEMIQRYQIAVPEFSRWLKSPNENIIVFAIRMIRAFKQEGGYAQLVQLLQHANYEIREETFMTLGDLGNPDALMVLKERYGYEAQQGRVQIIKAIGKIPDDSSIEFLRSVLEPSGELRLEAAEALAKIDSFGIKGIETILRRSDEDLQAVARHILDSKIHR